MIGLDDIMARNPCGEFPVDRVRELLMQRGTQTIDAAGVVDLDISPVAKIWMFLETGLTTKEQQEAVIAKMAAMMPEDSPEYQSFMQAYVISYKYPMLYLARTTGVSTRAAATEVTKQIVEFFREVI